MADLDRIIEKIEEVSENVELSKRVKDKLNKICSDLKDEKQDIGVRVTSAIYELDTISNDSSIPVDIKTILWNLIGELERVI
ncbi:MAG: UPF0147 family protein [Candidatus Altiarchaeota archaeon]